MANVRRLYRKLEREYTGFFYRRTPSWKVAIREAVGNFFDLPDQEKRKLFRRMINTCPVPICYRRLPGRQQGAYYPYLNEIVLREGLPVDMLLRVLLHEMAHLVAYRSGFDPGVDWRESEVIAEGAAYIAGRYFGLSMSDSFRYLSYYVGPDWVTYYGFPIREVAATLIALIEGKAVAA